MLQWWQEKFPNGCQFIEILDANQNLIKLAYGEKGQGKTLILLHGWGGWSYTWRHSVDALAEHFKVICLDFKGAGFSDKPIQAEVAGHQIIEIIRFIEQISDQPVILVGESLGGLVALAVAEQRPELIEQLIVIDAAIFPQKIPNLSIYLLGIVPLWLVRWFDKLRLVRFFYPLLYRVVKMNHAKINNKTSLKNFQSEIKNISYPYSHFPLAITKLIEDTKITMQELSKQARGEANLLTDIQQKLPNIQCPTLILWGEKDDWFPVAHAEKLHRILPNAELDVIASCGHHATSDAIEHITQAIINFTRKTF